MISGMPAEEVGVRRRQRAAPGTYIGPRRVRIVAIAEPDDDDEHRADREHPDVEPQPVQDLGQRLLGDLRVEERLAHPGPARRLSTIAVPKTARNTTVLVPASSRDRRACPRW